MPDILDDSVLTSLFPDEVVTRALVRDVPLPYGAGTMALITLDNGHDHTRPNTFGPAGLLALRDALESVAARATPGPEQRIAAVGVTGKPFIFAAGADLGVAALIRARDEALAVGRLGHDGIPAVRRAERAVVRVRQRRGPRRRPRARAALLLPDDLLGRHRGRVPRVLPRPAARLGRHLPAAAPDRPG